MPNTMWVQKAVEHGKAKIHQGLFNLEMSPMTQSPCAIRYQDASKAQLLDCPPCAEPWLAAGDL